jgi:flagellar hook-basal body complex protein FliE
MGAPIAPSASGSLSASSGSNDSLAVRLSREIQEARSLEREARDAVSALQSGRTLDVEGVLLATRKADAAFQMIQAVRNAMVQAYSEIREMRM